MASKPKWVKSILNIIGVNSLRLGGLEISVLKLVEHCSGINFTESNGCKMTNL